MSWMKFSAMASKLEKVNTTNPIAKLTIILWLLYFVGVGFRILGRTGFLQVIAFPAWTSEPEVLFVPCPTSKLESAPQYLNVLLATLSRY